MTQQTRQAYPGTPAVEMAVYGSSRLRHLLLHLTMFTNRTSPWWQVYARSDVRINIVFIELIPIRWCISWYSCPEEIQELSGSVVIAIIPRRREPASEPLASTLTLYRNWPCYLHYTSCDQYLVQFRYGPTWFEMQTRLPHTHHQHELISQRCWAMIGWSCWSWIITMLAPCLVGICIRIRQTVPTVEERFCLTFDHSYDFGFEKFTWFAELFMKP